LALSAPPQKRTSVSTHPIYIASAERFMETLAQRSAHSPAFITSPRSFHAFFRTTKNLIISCSCPAIKENFFKMAKKYHQNPDKFTSCLHGLGYNGLLWSAFSVVVTKSHDFT
jgi:hypothetical protein